MADMLNSGHLCLERQDSIDNPCKITPKQRTPRAGPTKPFFKKVSSQQQAHLRDIKTASNAIEISLFRQYIQLATLSIFLTYVSLAFLISCKFGINLLYLVIHFKDLCSSIEYVVNRYYQSKTTSYKLQNTSHGLTRLIFAQVSFCEINFWGFCGVFFANP